VRRPQRLVPRKGQRAGLMRGQSGERAGEWARLFLPVACGPSQPGAPKVHKEGIPAHLWPM
jgi:hypothetical protein